MLKCSKLQLLCSQTACLNLAPQSAAQRPVLVQSEMFAPIKAGGECSHSHWDNADSDVDTQLPALTSGRKLQRIHCPACFDGSSHSYDRASEGVSFFLFQAFLPPVIMIISQPHLAEETLEACTAVEAVDSSRKGTNYQLLQQQLRHQVRICVAVLT